MTRRKQDAPIDLTVAHHLTADLIASFQCPPGKGQAFLRDAKSPGLRVRATPNGAKKSFVFEAKLRPSGKTLRKTIGDVRTYSIEEARELSDELRVTVNQRNDPRELERQEDERKAREQAERVSRAAAEEAKAITVGDAWPTYMEQGRPLRKAAWKPRYRADLEKAAAPGGVPKKRGKGKTKPGHLAALMGVRLVDIDADRIRDWYSSEAKRAPVQAGRAVAMFSGFLRWCSMQKEYRHLVDRHAAKSEAVAALMPPKTKRVDALTRAQLAPWFAGTDKLRSRGARAYLQALVLTGARREEMAALKWSDIDFRWQKLTLADKVGDVRVIPLSNYLAGLLSSLPREKFADGTQNPYVFASSMSASGRIVEPRAPHSDVLTDACIPHLTIHGLRRTFALMGEEAGAPAGAIAQIMGHRPSAVAEGYKPRSIDQLHSYMETIERFILDAAEIAYSASMPTLGSLRVVK